MRCGNENQINVKKILTVAATVLMLAAVGNTYAVSVLPLPELPGITPVSFPDFGYTVKVKVSEQGQKGFKLKARGTGGGNYLTLPGSESLKIKGGGTNWMQCLTLMATFLKDP